MTTIIISKNFDEKSPIKLTSTSEKGRVTRSGNVEIYRCDTRCSVPRVKVHALRSSLLQVIIPRQCRLNGLFQSKRIPASIIACSEIPRLSARWNQFAWRRKAYESQLVGPFLFKVTFDSNLLFHPLKPKPCCTSSKPIAGWSFTRLDSRAPVHFKSQLLRD